jgi:hypothetical protein
MPTCTAGFKHVGVAGHEEPSVEYESLASFEDGMEAAQPTLSTHHAARSWFRIRRTSHGLMEKVLRMAT